MGKNTYRGTTYFKEFECKNPELSMIEEKLKNYVCAGSYD